MNMAEALSREIERVALIREAWRGMPDNHQAALRPGIALMSAAIEGAHLAAGSNNVLMVIQAHANLQGFVE